MSLATTLYSNYESRSEMARRRRNMSPWSADDYGKLSFLRSYRTVSCGAIHEVEHQIRIVTAVCGRWRLILSLALLDFFTGFVEANALFGLARASRYDANAGRA